MTNSLKTRGALIIALTLFSLAAIAPTFFRDSLPAAWTKTFEPVHLGLDLQGGMHLILGVDTDKAIEGRLDGLVDHLDGLLKEEDLIFKRIERLGNDGLAVTVYDDAAAGSLEKLIGQKIGILEPAGEARDGDYLVRKFRLNSREAQVIREMSVRQVLETLRNRIDQFGVSEPILQQEGADRVLVQLPGIKDTERAIALLGKTARLEFKMVAEEADPQAAVKGNLPPGTQLLYERRPDRATGKVTEIPIVVQEKTAMTGDLLSNAQVRIDTRFNEPYVAIDFNAIGAKRFDQVTAASVGKRMAIVLDNTVYSAPVIRERISGGSAQISGSFTEQEATDLAIILRAGSLPAPVKILENRTVGPSLGRDSIAQGKLAVTLAFLFVAAGMIVYYRWSGAVAVVAVILNFLFLLCAVILFKATLTLPGIAGIALTLGMAVDANVLIYERMREEARLGKPPRTSLEAGYEKAFWSIMDSNLTTLLSGLILFQFGTGPVKGFAVTLSVGILTTLFTAMFCSRWIFDLYLHNRDIKRLSV